MPTIDIDKDTIFYSARKSKYSDKKDLDAPPVDKCNCGRLNSKGIQYLYVAGLEVTIAEFSPVKKLNIIDFTDGNIIGPANSYRKIINENF